MIVTLTHFERGSMRVAIYEDATWWLQRRVWSCPDNPELGSFEDGDFDETPEQINAALAANS